MDVGNANAVTVDNEPATGSDVESMLQQASVMLQKVVLPSERLLDLLELVWKGIVEEMTAEVRQLENLPSSALTQANEFLVKWDDTRKARKIAESALIEVKENQTLLTSIHAKLSEIRRILDFQSLDALPGPQAPDFQSNLALSVKTVETLMALHDEGAKMLDSLLAGQQMDLSSIDESESGASNEQQEHMSLFEGLDEPDVIVGGQDDASIDSTTTVAFGPLHEDAASLDTTMAVVAFGPVAEDGGTVTSLEIVEVADDTEAAELAEQQTDPGEEVALNWTPLHPNNGSNSDQ